MGGRDKTKKLKILLLCACVSFLFCILFLFLFSLLFFFLWGGGFDGVFYQVCLYGVWFFFVWVGGVFCVCLLGLNLCHLVVFWGVLFFMRCCVC